LEHGVFMSATLTTTQENAHKGLGYARAGAIFGSGHEGESLLSARPALMDAAAPLLAHL